MQEPFLLCDPRFLAPSSFDGDARGAQDFWVRLIEWSQDRRVRIGVECRSFLLGELTRVGWPDFQPPRCPAALTRLASEGLNRLLTAVALPGGSIENDVGDVPTLDPLYTASEDAGLALALDARSAYCRSLVGIATTSDSWADQTANYVRFTPPPPTSLELVKTPRQAAHAQREVKAGFAFRGRRLTVVGHKVSQAVLDELASRLEIGDAQVRWLECEKGHKPNLDALKGMKSDRDLVCCLTGHIGHAGSEKTSAAAAKCGVHVLRVEHSAHIVEALCQHFNSVGAA